MHYFKVNILYSVTNEIYILIVTKIVPLIIGGGEMKKGPSLYSEKKCTTLQ